MPKGDGSIPSEEVAIMKGAGRWMKVNSEAIHATRPWKIPAEGPAEILFPKQKPTHFEWAYAFRIR